MNKKLVLIPIGIIMFVFFTSVAFAQETNINSVSVIDQIQGLKNQVNVLDQVNGKILNTIYFALGGLITVFLAIIGLNFFQNFSLNKRKMDAIKEEMENELKKVIFEIREQNKKNLENINAKIEPKIKSEVQTSLSQLKGKIDQLKEDYDEINRDNLIRSAFEYKTKKQMGYILNLISVLELDIKKNWDFRINESLDYISECLDISPPNSDSLTQLQRALDKLPSEYSVQKKHIESKMKL